MKKTISFILILALCLSLVSCSVFDSIFGYKYEDHTLALAAPKINANYKDYTADDYVEFLDKLSAFSAKLTAEVYADTAGTKNFVISPVSVYMALALAAECASGETRDQILNAVGVTYDEVQSFTKYLYASSNVTYNSNGLGKQVSSIKQLSNSIWVDDGAQVKDSGINNLANNYNCDMFSVDFGSSEANKAIRAYIKDRTHGLIDSDPNLSPETLITLINTFYLKDIWNPYGNNLAFTDSAYEFANADGSTTSTKLLEGYYNNGNIYEGDGYRTFFTTTEHNFKIKFIVPTDGHTIDEVFTTENIHAVDSITDYGYVDDENKLLHHTRVLFPEYEASFDDDISDTLKEEFGIEDIFDFEKCDFSNITDDPIACTGVVHKSCLEVNRRGIEGAAVSYIPGAGAPGPGEYKDVYHDFIVDRAFGFVLTDSYGAVLFCGVVNSI